MEKAMTKEQWLKKQNKKAQIKRRGNTSIGAMAQDLHSLQSRRAQ